MDTRDPPVEDEMRERLLAAADGAREHAHAPYSGFAVGAAALFEGDCIFEGCNVENASLGATVCAERVAILHGIAHGKRRLRAVAVVSDSQRPAWPCGLCRQVILEFGPKCEVLTRASDGSLEWLSIAALMPRPFVRFDR